MKCSVRWRTQSTECLPYVVRRTLILKLKLKEASTFLWRALVTVRLRDLAHHKSVQTSACRNCKVTSVCRVVLKGHSGSFNVYSRRECDCVPSRRSASKHIIPISTTGTKVDSRSSHLTNINRILSSCSVGAGVVDAMSYPTPWVIVLLGLPSRQSLGKSVGCSCFVLCDRNSTRNKLPLNNYWHLFSPLVVYVNSNINCKRTGETNFYNWRKDGIPGRRAMSH